MKAQRPIILVIGVLWLGAAGALTAEPSGMGPEPSMASATNAVPEQGGALRDPFWPVGWTPPPLASGIEVAGAPKQGLVTVKWEEAVRQLRVTGLIATTGGGYVATVKGLGAVEAGDTVTVEFEGLVYKWRIAAITAQGIVPERVAVHAPR